MSNTCNTCTKAPTGHDHDGSCAARAAVPRKVGRIGVSMKDSKCITFTDITSVTLDIAAGEVRYEQPNGDRGGVLLSAVGYLVIYTGRIRWAYQDLSAP